VLKKLKLITATLFTILVSAHGINAAEIRIARTPKLATIDPLLYRTVDYLPKTAEKYGIKDLKVTFVDILNANDANTGLLLGKIDIAVSGINGFYPVYNKDTTKLKLITGWETFNMYMFCSNSNIKSIKDLNDDSKIAMKATEGGHHLMLREYTADVYGAKQAEKFTKNIVVMPTAQIFQTMTSDKPSVDCALADTPIANNIINSGKAHIIESPNNKTSFPFSNVSYSSTTWLKENDKLAHAFIDAVNLASQDYLKNPADVIQEFIKMDNMSESVDDLIKIKKENNDVYDTSLVAAIGTMKIYRNLGLLDGAPDNIPDNDKIFDSKAVKVK
jgi:ABC-type nitrate/sulfonate/bicarbonate transport system substrate-binding protein